MKKIAKTIWLCFAMILCLQSFGQNTYLDNFNAVSYANNNGTHNWATNWIETGDTNLGPTSQYLSINGNRLRLHYLFSETIRRTADLSGATSATLTFNWQTVGLNGTQALAIQASSNGGTNYTTIGTINGTTTGSFSQDISAYISSNTTIRFRKSNRNWGSSDYAYLDNVQITAITAAAVTIADVAVNEDAGTATFTATHSGANTAGSFTVNYTTANGTAATPGDYTSSSGTLNFNGTVGDTEQIVITINDDVVFEGNETFTIQLTGTSDGTVNISDTATGTIQDNESDPNTPRPYEERHAINVMGNFKMKGNTNLQCISNCPGTPTSNNPPVVMGYTDVDTDASTVNSSYSNFAFPTGATVEWAGLYWGGVYNSSRSGIVNFPAGSLNIDQVKLRGPGAATYTTVNAQVRNIETTRFPGWRSFMSHADVTSIVQAAGSGNYYVADIALATGSGFTGPYGGWTMVVVYKDPTEKTRRISIWDGFDFFGFGANENFTVTGLLTPGTGAFESHAGYFGFDGEANQTGDFVSINGTALSNTLNPNNNTLNGTISEFGVDVGGRNPNLSYSWGVDIDVFDATGSVPNSATDMNVVLGSSNEGIWGGVFVTSNEIAFPAVASIIYTPSTVNVGDESTVSITIDNPANGISLTNFALTDGLPAGMTISTTPDASSSCGGTIAATAGANSFNITGVNIPAGSSCNFTFDVVTSAAGTYTNTISPSDVSNTQNIPIAGESSGVLTVLPLPDNDGDGISDVVDLDDDNDGIPDADELSNIISTSQNDCTGETTLDFSATPTLVSGTALTQGAVYRIPNITAGTDALVTIVLTNNATVSNLDNNSSDAAAFRPQTAFTLASPGDRGYIEYNILFVNSGGTTPVVIPKFFANFNDIDGNNNYAEQLWSDNPTSYIISNPTELTMSTDGSWVIGTSGTNEFTGAGNGNPQVNFGTSYNFRSGISVRVGAEARIAGASSGGRQHNIEFSCLTNYVAPATYGIDTDFDGIANHLDLDSDNDGIYDAFEAGHLQSYTNGVVNGTYGPNGLVDAVETTPESGTISYAILNTDATDTPNYLDTDSDNDGCVDANEAYASANADADSNGYYGSGSPPATNTNGTVVGATYFLPQDGDSNGTRDFLEVTAPLITTQPVDTQVCPGCSTTIFVTASNAGSYQWQLFNGSVWVDLTDTGIYSGTSTNSLVLTNVTTAENSNQYRVVISSLSFICGNTISDAITLTVRVTSVITNRKITHRVNKN